MKAKKMKPFTVTLVWLTAMGACPEQRWLFAKKFGKRVRVTEEMIRKHGQKFQMQWLVGKLCTEVGELTYDNDVSHILAKYWRERRASDLLFQYTKRNLLRLRVNYEAMEKAARPIRRARDKAEDELAIRILRDYRMA